MNDAHPPYPVTASTTPDVGRSYGDIPWPGNPRHLEAFRDHVELAVDLTRRPRSPRPPPSVDVPQNRDTRTSAPAAKIDLVLYTSAASAKSQKAVRMVRQVLELYEPSQVRFSTCDLAARPADGETDAVVFTPTLVKQGPGPRLSIIGNLEHAEILCELLDASGVDRRWPQE